MRWGQGGRGANISFMSVVFQALSACAQITVCNPYSNLMWSFSLSFRTEELEVQGVEVICSSSHTSARMATYSSFPTSKIMFFLQHHAKCLEIRGFISQREQLGFTCLWEIIRNPTVSLNKSLPDWNGGRISTWEWETGLITRFLSPQDSPSLWSLVTQITVATTFVSKVPWALSQTGLKWFKTILNDP